jgi:hypothetical protein
MTRGNERPYLTLVTEKEQLNLFSFITASSLVFCSEEFCSGNVLFCTMMHLSAHHRRQKEERSRERERDWSDVSRDDRHLSVADFLLLAGLIFLRHEIVFPLPSFPSGS